jgi:hypothetical protein
MKNLFKIIFLITIFFILSLLFTGRVFAASLSLNTSKNIISVGEQFYVDLMLNPEGDSVNALGGSVNFSSENFSFIRAEDGKSMVNLWVEKPQITGIGSSNSISFSGIISNGFQGVIDPFNPDVKLPGLIVRLVFEGKKPGEANFSTSSFNVNLNDGLGTEIPTVSVFTSVLVNNNFNEVKYMGDFSDSPKLEAHVVQNSDLFDNKFVLIFDAFDGKTGIKNVMIKEGNRDWKEIQSPYLLKDQSRHSSIAIQATNFSGASIVLNIDRIPYDWKLIIKICVLVFIGCLIICLIIFFIKKRHAR